MHSNDNDCVPQGTTEVRVIAHEATLMPTPEIRALARIDATVSAKAVARFTPVSRRFGTLADDRRPSRTACSPATLAQTIWSPQPPDIIIGWGASAWDWFTPSITRGIARIDMLKIARLVWPRAPSYEPLRLAAYVRSDYPRPALPAHPHPLEAQVQAIADLLASAVIASTDQMIRIAAELDATGPSPAVQAAFGSMAGDPFLQALVKLSTVPMRPVGTIPGPWDEAEAWFSIGGEDLSWIANNEDGAAWDRDAARAEIDRRAARDAALLLPRSLLRRITD